MRPGDTIQITRGEHKGRKAIVSGSDSFFYHVQLLTPSGRKAANGALSLHRTAIAPLEDVGERR